MTEERGYIKFQKKSDITPKEIVTVNFEIQTNQTIGELQNLQTSYLLNGRNYLKWSQLVKTFLKGKGKINHLLSASPSSGDPKFAAWEKEDSVIMPWLWNSMMPEVWTVYVPEYNK